MTYLGANLRYLRKKKGLTQADLAQKMNVNRSLIGAYEEGRSEPKIASLLFLCELFKVNLDELIQKPLSGQKIRSRDNWNNQHLRILPVTVDLEGNEGISLIPQKAAAGYTRGYADMEYIEQLQTAVLPFPELQNSATQRLFQIEGDSMLPVQPGSYILGEYLEKWTDIKDYKCYLLITANEGIVYKRVVNQVEEKGSLRLISDNREYAPYDLPAEEVLEIWRARGIFSLEIPEVQVQSQNENHLYAMVSDIKKELEELKEKMNKQ